MHTNLRSVDSVVRHAASWGFKVRYGAPQAEDTEIVFTNGEFVEVIYIATREVNGTWSIRRS